MQPEHAKLVRGPVSEDNVWFASVPSILVVGVDKGVYRSDGIPILYCLNFRLSKSWLSDRISWLLQWSKLGKRRMNEVKG